MCKISPFVFALALFAIICAQSTDGLTVPTPHKQCVDMGFAGVCRSTLTTGTASGNVSKWNCKLVCSVKVGTKYYKQSAGVPQNGTPCGTNKICHAGRCITAMSEITYVGANIDKSCRGMVPLANRITPKTTPRPEI